MICGRCGTEHNSPDNICPRCYYGRPKEKKPLPIWAKWLIGAGSPLLVAGLILALIFIPRIGRIDDSWLEGTWQGEDMALTLNVEDHTFQLINGENFVFGEFVLENETDLRLIDEDGKNYVYSYVRKDPNTLSISFADGLAIVRTVLEREVDPYAEEIESEE